MTLSYVWGSQRSDVQGEPFPAFSIKNALLTVRDAIIVVRNLGRKYLSVDRCCIDRNSLSGKDLMIGNVDVIYESAEATIVALYGKTTEAVSLVFLRFSKRLSLFWTQPMDV